MMMNNLRQLHIIRGIAALYVAMGHAKVVFWSGGREYLKMYPRETWNPLDYLLFAIDMLSSAAQEFVTVFFVLSGFFIAYSFEKNNWTFSGFITNRIVRIYPPYLFSMLMAVAVFLFIGSYHPALFSGTSTHPILIRMTNSFNELTWVGFLKALFFLPQNDYIAGNLSYWSLLAEWLFYFIIPFLLFRYQWGVVFFGLCYLANLVVRVDTQNDFLKFIVEYGFYFFFGVGAFVWLKPENWLQKMPPRWVAYGSILVLALLTIGLGVADFAPYSSLVACFLTVVAIMTLLAYPITGILFRIGVFLGDISYSLYVCHLPIYYFLYAFLSKYYQQEIFYSRLYWFMLPIAIFISYLSYIAIEKKSLHYIQLLKNKP